MDEDSNIFIFALRFAYARIKLKSLDVDGSLLFSRHGKQAIILHDLFNNLVGTSWTNTNYLSFDADPLLENSANLSAQAGDHTSLNLNASTVRYWPQHLQVLNLGQIQEHLDELSVVLRVIPAGSVAVAAGKLAPGAPRRVAAGRRGGEGGRRHGLYRPLNPFLW